MRPRPRRSSLTLFEFPPYAYLFLSARKPSSPDDKLGANDLHVSLSLAWNLTANGAAQFPLWLSAGNTNLAEAVRFELTEHFCSAVFKTAGLNHSPKPPYCGHPNHVCRFGRRASYPKSPPSLKSLVNIPRRLQLLRGFCSLTPVVAKTL